MSRTVAEWIGRTDNSAAPPRVKAKLYIEAGGKCRCCTRFIDGRKLKAEADHIVALINGGKNSESNLQLLCNECHAVKTKTDVAEKSKVARVRAKHIGVLAPRQKIQSAGFRKSGPQNSASRPLRRKSEMFRVGEG